MKISVIGTGYVGLVTGACFADMGNDVWCIDIDKEKIDNLKKGIIPIYEPGLEELVKRNFSQGRLSFSTDLKESLHDSLFVLIAVGTPPDEDGSADLKHVINVAREIGQLMDNYKVVINKSTVPIGTFQKVRTAIQEELDKRNRNDVEFDVVSNPEFLKEGNAIEDFMKPDRIVVGVDNVRTAELLKELYDPFVRIGHPLLIMDIPSAELTKYASNAMLATRISFMNEIARLCDATGANVEMIRKGIGTDSRIGKPFLYAGLGYGGSCFPKDVKAIIKTFNEFDIESKILAAVDIVNVEQRPVFIDKILKYYKNDVSNKTFSIWGLSFKPQTDDIREAPSIDIISSLIEKGAKVRAYDPVAIEIFQSQMGNKNIEYVDKEYEVLDNTDALLLLTEWHQFRRPDFEEMKKRMNKHVIFDGRNQYDPDRMKERGFEYFSIGRP
ncbi:UDP-glucose dehydrogenase family protein [Spirochaetota bacterium]